MSERFKAIRILFKSVVGTANVIVILLLTILGLSRTEFHRTGVCSSLIWGWDFLCFAF